MDEKKFVPHTICAEKKEEESLVRKRGCLGYVRMKAFNDPLNNLIQHKNSCEN